MKSKRMTSICWSHILAVVASLGLALTLFWAATVCLAADPSVEEDVKVMFYETDLAIEKRASKQMVEVGETLQYQITVSHVDFYDAYNVVVTDTMPNNVTILRMPEASQGSCRWGADAYNVYALCDLGEILEGESAHATVTVKVKEVGILTNTAQVDAPWELYPEDNTSVVTVTVTAHPALIVSFWENSTLTLRLHPEGWRFPEDFDDGIVHFRSEGVTQTLRNMWAPWEGWPEEAWRWEQYIPLEVDRVWIETITPILWVGDGPWWPNEDGLGLERVEMLRYYLPIVVKNYTPKPEPYVTPIDP